MPSPAGNMAGMGRKIPGPPGPVHLHYGPRARSTFPVHLPGAVRGATCDKLQTHLATPSAAKDPLRALGQPYQAASAVTVRPDTSRIEPQPAAFARATHRPARPALRGDGRQAAAASRGVAAGPRGCQAVPRAGAVRPEARQPFLSSQLFGPYAATY